MEPEIVSISVHKILEIQMLLQITTPHPPLEVEIAFFSSTL
jgi:hypothetical protein